MSWVRETEKPWIQRFCAASLKAGPIPKHVAFIMDGNRRFAKKNSMEKAEGHLKGFDKLSETLECCADLGITEVTVYAFSIENFKRSKDEVDGLMELARQKFEKLMEEKNMLDKHGVAIRVLGNLSLLPRDLQEIIAEAVNLTKHNTKAVLNVCFAYTSRDEMCASMREIAEGVKLGLIKESDISEELMEKCLYTHKSEDPDLLIRTSGEVRLSDFLLWQTSFSVLSFVKVLWPEFSVWHLYAAVLTYQQNFPGIQKAKEASRCERERQQRKSDYQCVTRSIEIMKSKGLQDDYQNIPQKLQCYAKEREARIQSFLLHVNAKRDTYLDQLEKARKSKKL